MRQFTKLGNCMGYMACHIIMTGVYGVILSRHVKCFLDQEPSGIDDQCT